VPNVPHVAEGLMSDHDTTWEPGWSTCLTKDCIGVPMERGQCLAHLDPQVRKSFLAALKPGTELDLRGIPIDSELLVQLLAAMQQEDGRPLLGNSRFERAQFNGPANFHDAQFSGHASFEGTRFNGAANFTNAQFDVAAFDNAHFSQTAWFEATQFRMHASFAEAQFTDEAVFSGARFGLVAIFTNANFGRQVRFDFAEFGGLATFYNVRFRGIVGFSGVQFHGLAGFDGAGFQQAGTFGPLLAEDHLDLSRAVFEGTVLLEMTGGKLSIVGARFNESASFRLRYAALMLDMTVFAKPSVVAYAKSPFARRDPESSVYFSCFNEAPVESIDVASRPRLLSLGGVDASTLTLSDLDLRACVFEDAQHLDQIRIEGAPPFADPPRGWRLGGVEGKGLPVWHWTRRQTLAEEHTWRANVSLPTSPSGRLHPKQAGWYPPACRLPDWVAERLNLRVRPHLGPEHLASTYRALRKAFEDDKNEPGAADFYYGEMEMRRLNPRTPWPERVILFLYWLVSGYSLRGLRALAWLGVAVAGLAALLQVIGFNGGDPSFRDAVIYTAQATISIPSSNKALTEHISWAGETLRIALRLIGPLLLGLALLSVRNRVKR
jgi:uncharacterized protein YjbI with pentapeptide repeats